jgi:hypothetical protein
MKLSKGEEIVKQKTLSMSLNLLIEREEEKNFMMT